MQAAVVVRACLCDGRRDFSRPAAACRGRTLGHADPGRWQSVAKRCSPRLHAGAHADVSEREGGEQRNGGSAYRGDCGVGIGWGVCLSGENAKATQGSADVEARFPEEAAQQARGASPVAIPLPLNSRLTGILGFFRLLVDIALACLQLRCSTLWGGRRASVAAVTLSTTAGLEVCGSLRLLCRRTTLRRDRQRQRRSQQAGVAAHVAHGVYVVDAGARGGRLPLLRAVLSGRLLQPPHTGAHAAVPAPHVQRVVHVGVPGALGCRARAPAECCQRLCTGVRRQARCRAHAAAHLGCAGRAAPR
ncbi:hypothetical protein LMJF_31_0940 [Leishmania major strain Friedlin]|uniref:Uncharacterized protein n=1 Tax=Leishmania major TaxID=5664 RepID=Q4Q6G9_LEIMA|nr:hypothetical protein LMJF_31_0940 [Leishmania major strain Friedlin]CAG9579251.1 hypothetical_protein_-_conserved [Leishmania major strain Friedlin]CAJ08281.1 hypothetical protein LMJF_31_0940 [Leishmania major strain Friedlin]|eukprot:XP_001685079.1 hypothetical protein LMJF_31_0940 [Leishmania major strain Friedlin]